MLLLFVHGGGSDVCLILYVTVVGKPQVQEFSRSNSFTAQTKRDSERFYDIYSGIFFFFIYVSAR